MSTSTRALIVPGRISPMLSAPSVIAPEYADNNGQATGAPWDRLQGVLRWSPRVPHQDRTP